jgi:hypothetical protein
VLSTILIVEFLEGQMHEDYILQDLAQGGRDRELDRRKPDENDTWPELGSHGFLLEPDYFLVESPENHSSLDEPCLTIGLSQ